MASPSGQHNFAVRVFHRCISTVAEFERSRPVWALTPNLGAHAEFATTEFRAAEFRRSHPLTPEFGRSRRVWALPPRLGAPARRRTSGNLILNGDDLYLYAYVCVLCCQY